ncbi:MAG: phosphatase PAP2 family protein [Ignavibacteriales bacterium]|nr:phosphatase PAP2 family protein [Ignavibacteriales bacterium]
MADFLFSIDTAVFYFFNHALSNRVFDIFFSFITTSRNWVPVYIIGIMWIIYTKKKKGAVIVLLALLLVALTDMLGFRVFKEIFARPRPFKTLTDVLLPNGPTGTFSFPSNHALNNFAIATFFSAIYPKARVWLFIAASLVAISRVYTGVHYPSDILAGAAAGAAFGYLFVRLHQYILQRYEKRLS